MTGPEDFRSELDDGFAAADERIRARIEALAAAPPSSPAAVAPGQSGTHDTLEPYAAVGSGRAASAGRRWLAAAAAVVLVATGVGIAIARRSTAPVGPPSVEQLAQAAASVPADVDGSEVLRTVQSADGAETITSISISADGALTTTLVSSTDPAAPPPGWQDPAATIAGFSGPALQSLPTDPSALVAAVADQLGAAPSSPTTAAALAEISAMPFLSPALRSAAIAGLGVSGGVPGDDATGQGRAVVDGENWAVAFDPATGTAVEAITHVRPGDSGAVTRWAPT